MKQIATYVDDTPEQIDQTIARQRPGFAMDNYFYRSHLVYERELERIFSTAGCMPATSARFRTPTIFLSTKSARTRSS